jgi:hypothetical protein
MSKKYGHCQEGNQNGNYKHGMKGTRFYRIWKEIKTRCYNKNRIYYKNYGGRGIGVCPEWINSFETFYNDMFATYTSHVGGLGETNTTIDRINNDGNYSKENCRWATRSEQMRNSRNARYITFNNREKIISDWAQEYDISVSGLHSRLKKGLKIEEALLNPLGRWAILPTKK